MLRVELTDLPGEMLPVKEESRMTPGFWPEHLEEWACHLLIKGKHTKVVASGDRCGQHGV